MKRWLLRLFGLPGGYGCEPDACFKRVCESCGRPAREAVSADTPKQDSGTLASSLSGEHDASAGASEDVSK